MAINKSPTISEILLQNGTASLKDFYPLTEVKTMADKKSLAAKVYALATQLLNGRIVSPQIKFTTADRFSPAPITTTLIMPRFPSL